MLAFGAPFGVWGEVGAAVAAFDVVPGAGELLEGDSDAPGDTRQCRHRCHDGVDGFRGLPWSETDS